MINVFHSVDLHFPRNIHFLFLSSLFNKSYPLFLSTFLSKLRQIKEMANNSIVSFVVRRLINIPARVREKKRRRRRRREGRSTEEGLLSPSFLLAFFPLPVSSNSFLRSSRGADPRRFPVPRCYLAATDTRPLASEFRYVRVRLSPRLLVGTGVFRRGEETGRWRTVVGGGRRSVGGV